MSKSAPEYQLISLPSKSKQSDFESFVNDKLAYCLKNGFDNVILDLGLIESFKKTHLTIITRWLRNLQSLGGGLVLTGVNEDMLKMFRSTKISGICDIYTDLDQFKRKNPDTLINDITEQPEKEAEETLESQQNMEINESDETVPSLKPEETEDGNSELLLDDAPDTDPVSEDNDKEEMEDISDDDEMEISEHEGSITESINIQKLAELHSEGDVSDKLSFLKGNESANKPDPQPENNLEMDQEKSEELSEDLSEETPEEKTEELSEVMSEEMSEEEPEEKGDPEVEAVNESPENGPSLPEDKIIPSEDEINDIFKDFEDEQLEQDLPDDDLETSDSEDLPENDVEISDSINSASAETEKFDYSTSKTGMINDMVEMSGEYECLACNMPEYFLKGSRYESCNNPKCDKKEEGWEPVVILF